MRPYKGKVPRRFQGPQNDTSGDWLVCLAFVIVVACIALAAFENEILRAIGW